MEYFTRQGMEYWWHYVKELYELQTAGECVGSIIPRPNFTQMRVSMMAIQIASQQNAPSFLTGALRQCQKEYSMLQSQRFYHENLGLNRLIYNNMSFSGTSSNGRRISATANCMYIDSKASESCN
jgi:hypothetical protein